jgi:hypothetical protein
MAKTTQVQPEKWIGIIKEVKKQLGILKRQGISPTLRTMHYRLVTLNIGYGNTLNEYKSLSRKTARARECGILPIKCFVDNGREVINNGYHGNNSLKQPGEIIDDKIESLDWMDKLYPRILPKWYNQKHYVEAWVEKAALESTFVKFLEGTATRIVPNKGYSSLSFIFENFERLSHVENNEGKEIHVRYFGDYDPSGDDMDRDIKERIERLSGGELDIDFKRVAVTPEQIEQYDLPPMPTDSESIQKFHNDARTKDFVEKNGGREFAVELDALTVYAPEDFKEMVQDSVSEFYNEDIYEKELEERSTPEFKREVRQQVQTKVKEFLDMFDVDNVDDSDSDKSEGDE